MATFSLLGGIEPFLHCSLRQGESIFCEANAMVMMESNLDLTGTLNGGIMQALMRRFANDESLFQQKIQATRGDGDCLLAPTLDGDMMILDVGSVQYTLSDGAFVAGSSGMDLKASIQRNLGGALFGDTGGFMVMRTEGVGQVVVSGFGSLFEIQVEHGKPVTIDNGHVVAWDSNLSYELALGTNQNQGFLGRMINSVTSGEGMVLKFSGQGKVVLCSRNRDNYQGWLQSILGTNSGGRSSSGGGLLGGIL